MSKPLTRFPSLRTITALCAILYAGVSGLANAGVPDNVADLSIEDLMNIEITSASRKAQRLADTAAAVFVITNDDIRRSGATSIPEVLRMVPGVQVARIANNRWAVTVRGFDGRYANKLLVLRDGRSIYSPLFSGVVWEDQDMNLEDIDRIEVIRGPGAALWGANAVNGVINIISRKAKDTQGGMISAGVGTLDRGMLTARYGGSIDDNTQYRVYAKVVDRAAAVDMNEQSAGGTSGAEMGGFRLDKRLSDHSRVTVSGEAHRSHGGDIWGTFNVTPPYSISNTVKEHNSGAHLLGRYELNQDDGSAMAFQMFAEHDEINVDPLMVERRNTVDLDFQHRLQWGDRNDLVWGLNYRHSRDSLRGEGFVSFVNPNRTFKLASIFFQDEIRLIPDKLRLTLGARLEHNNFSGTQPQPNVRLFWTPDGVSTFWTAASRATRTPSRGELDSNVMVNVQAPFSAQNPTPFPVLIRSVPNSSGNLKSEQVDSIEVGHRVQIGPQLTLDTTLFSNRYRDLRATGSVTPTLEFMPQPVLVMRTPVDNSASADTRGLEIAADWRPYSWWRLQPSYTWFRISLPVTGDPVRDATTAIYAGTNPRHQLSLRSQFDLAERQRLDVWLRYVGDLTWGNVPSRWDLDVRYAWRPRKDLELAVAGQNLLYAQRPQFLTDFQVSPLLQIKRAAQFNAKWQF